MTLSKNSLFIFLVLSLLFSCNKPVSFKGKWIQIKEGKPGQMRNNRDYITSLEVTSSELKFSFLNDEQRTEVDPYHYDKLKNQITFTEQLECYQTTDYGSLIISNKQMKCNRFFHRVDQLKVKRLAEDVLIMIDTINDYHYYFLKEKLYYKMLKNEDLQNTHLATVADSINFEKELSSLKKEKEFKLRQGAPFYSFNPNELIHFFQKNLDLPMWHQDPIQIPVEGIVTSEGIFKIKKIDVNSLEKQFNEESKISFYTNEIRRNVQNMGQWLPKLSPDSIPVSSSIKIIISFKNGGARYGVKYGIANMKDYFNNNIKYPSWHPKWSDPNIEILIKGKINTDGDLEDISIVKNEAVNYFSKRNQIDYYAQEAIRVAKQMPPWIPKVDEKGNPVLSEVGLFVNF